ncbi:MAG: hypothetical protein ACD_10C00004G0002 [uncultured bacterium]|nr:MAG: hypothetical protein ACD_10C00004G0002 [uncultured bacterium]
MVEAFELAVILVQIVMTGREATGREGERDFAVDENFGFNVSRLALVQGFDQRARCFQRRCPTFQTVAGIGGEGGFVIDIEVRPGDEILALNQVDRTQVIGFDHAAGNVGQFVDQAA